MFYSKFQKTAVVIVMMVAIISGTKADTQSTSSYKARFFKLCDLACQELSKETLHQKYKQYYKDSYSVRALAVAYDMTGEEKYLDACKQWSDKMVKLQDGMIPKGAYYINYFRKPGESQGQWFAADSSSIAHGILATAVRCSDKIKKEYYLNSVFSFSDLMIDNYVTESGGITDGLWEKSDKAWWCSSGIFGSLMFSLYYETGEEKYLNVGYGAIDWLNAQDLETTGPLPLSGQGPAMYMYTLEAYSAGLRFISPDTLRYKKVIARIEDSMKWIAKHQNGQGGNNKWDYNTQWGSKGGGLPFHMYIYSQYIPNMHALAKAADMELEYIYSGPLDQPDRGGPGNTLTQLMNFTMMSLAEKLSPGAMYRR